MGYMKIENLYRNQTMLIFKRCYALEKIHGTSAHIKWKDNQLTFYSGGEKHENFIALFDHEKLKSTFESMGHPKITVYGEAYGGKQQGMRLTYGDSLKFIVFDVRIGDSWLSVPNMDNIATKLGLEVVPWEETSTDLKDLDAIKMRPSEVAVRRGCGEDKMREGIVLRPIEEMTLNNGSRIIVKHKREEFSETKTSRKVDPEKAVILMEANAIAEEWVTFERIKHVISHLTIDGVEPTIEKTGLVIKEMVNDVYTEGKGEIIESKEASAAIGRRAALLFKQYLRRNLQQTWEVGEIHGN